MSSRVLIGVFEDEDHLIKATSAAREANLEIVDVFAPYAVHGIDRAMGLTARAAKRGTKLINGALFFDVPEDYDPSTHGQA